MIQGLREEQIIYQVISGSQAYGLNTPESDIDIRGIMIPDKEFYFSPFKNVEQFISNDPDTTIFAFNKFIKLMAENNPNILELCFIDDPNCIQVVKWPAEVLRKNRDAFLSAKCRFTYAGYAYQQMRRIKNHKKWLDHPPSKPHRKDFGLKEDLKIFTNPALNSMLDGFRNHIVGKSTVAIKELIIEEVLSEKISALVSDAIYGESVEYFKEFALNYFTSLASGIIREDLSETMIGEINYYNQKRQWDGYQKWLKNRNPKRAEMERKYGHDLKHSTHLCRLLVQAEEILTKGTLTVNVSNVKEIRAVKNGEWSFDYLLKWADDKNAQLDEIYDNNTYVVPFSPDVKKIEAMTMEILEEHYKKEK